MNNIDITPYMTDQGLIRLDDFLRDNGCIGEEQLMSTRIDTVAIAGFLHVSLKTLYSYINAGLIELGPDRRMSIASAFKLDFKALQREAKLQKGVPHKRQNRTK